MTDNILRHYKTDPAIERSLNILKNSFKSNYDLLIPLLELYHYDKSNKIILSTYHLDIRHKKSNVLCYAVRENRSYQKMLFYCYEDDNPIEVYTKIINDYEGINNDQNQHISDYTLVETFSDQIVNLVEFEKRYSKNSNCDFRQDRLTGRYKIDNEEFIYSHGFSFYGDESNLKLEDYIGDITFSLFLDLASSRENSNMGFFNELESLHADIVNECFIDYSAVINNISTRLSKMVSSKYWII